MSHKKRGKSREKREGFHRGHQTVPCLAKKSHLHLTGVKQAGQDAGGHLLHAALRVAYQQYLHLLLQSVTALGSALGFALYVAGFCCFTDVCKFSANLLEFCLL